jgi:hypothetical protein
MKNPIPAIQKNRAIDIGVSSYLILLGVLYGCMAAGQILGFTRLYQLPWVIILSLAFSIASCWALLKYAKPFLKSVLETGSGSGAQRWLEWTCYGIGLLLFILLILVPLARWPYSSISTTLNWDAGLYHFPKAIEMVNTGSAWDLSIAYGEYPFGYETLIALAFTLSRNALLFGTVHAVIASFFFLSLWLLACRYIKRISSGVLFFLISVVMVSYTLSGNIASNPWSVFNIQIDMIGKNDLFIGAAVLAFLLFAPIGPKQNQARYSLSGMALTSMIAASIKPNGLLAVLPAWLLLLIYRYLEFHKSRLTLKKISDLLLAALAMLPGFLWAVRNLIAAGHVVSTDSLGIMQWSIINNLSNPFFYRYLPKQLILLMAVVLLALIFTFPLKRIHWSISGAFLVLLASFAITPATAFFLTNQEPTQIAWRFGIALLSFELLCILILLEPVIEKSIQLLSRPKFLPVGISLLVVLFGAWGIKRNINRIAIPPGSDIVLRDQFQNPVGIDGYFSVYDYIQKNVRNSVVWIENGLPFYTYGPGFTNTVTRSRPADYIAFISTAGNTPESRYPDRLNTLEWNKTWLLVYEDSQGRVYKRK